MSDSDGLLTAIVGIFLAGFGVGLLLGVFGANGGVLNITPNRCTKGEVMEYNDAKYICRKLEEKVWQLTKEPLKGER